MSSCRAPEALRPEADVPLPQLLALAVLPGKALHLRQVRLGGVPRRGPQLLHQRLRPLQGGHLRARQAAGQQN